MTAQSPSTLIASDIDLGNCILYYAPEPFTSFSSAMSSTAWRKFGLMKEGVQLDVTKEVIEFFSGFPATLQQQYFSAEDLRLSGQLLETTIRNLARVLGGLTVSETVEPSSPAPCVVASGSTTTVIQVDDATGYARGDEIRVTSGSVHQYGRIRSINNDADEITLYEGLSGDTAPDAGDALAKIAQSHFDMGALTAPANLAVKLSHQMPGGYGSYDLIVINGQMTGNISMLWADNTQTPESIGIPFEFRALSDPAIESGNTARWVFSQS